MATVDDLSQGVVSALAGILFPGVAYLNGAVANVTAPWTGAPGAPALTIPTRLYRGAPTIEELDADLAAGVAQVCVTCVPGMSRNTSRFQPYFTTVSANVPTFTVAWDSESATFGGVCGAGQVVGMTVNRVCYAYRMTDEDTPATVAAVFAAQVPGGASVGAVFTAFQIMQVSVVCDQLGMLHTGQQQQMVQVAVLAPAGAGAAAALERAALGSVVNALQTMQRPDGTITRFIGLPDGTSAHVAFHHSVDDDTPRNDDLWRRWVYFRCEFDQTIPIVQHTALALVALLAPPGGGLVWIGPAPRVSNVVTDGQGNILADENGNFLGSVI
jgi:hypothetical protein